MFVPKDELTKLYSGDKSKFLTALAAAGLGVTDANGKQIYGDEGYPKIPNLNGTDEMIYSLSKRYEDSVSLPLAAAEFGEAPDEFMKSLAGAGQDIAIRLGRRLDQGAKVVPRDVIETEFKELLPHVTDLALVDLSSLTAAAAPAAIPKTTPPPVAGETFDLSLVSDRSAYSVNELPVFTITPAKDCYLQILDVDGHGTATVLYPNKFQQENHLKAGQDFKFPGDDAPYQFRFADPGTETVTASCSVDDHPIDGIKLDKSRDFTEVGNYEAHLSRAIQVVPKSGGGGAKPAAPTDTIARTAIKLLVK